MGLMDDVKSKKKQKEAENWFSMGIKSQDPEKKLEYFTRSLELEPNNISAWLKKGRILEDMGRFDEAKKSYDRAILLDPELDIRLKEENSFPQHDTDLQDTVREQKQNVVEETQYTFNEADNLPATSEERTGSEIEEENQEEFSFNPPLGEESLFSNINKNETFREEEVKETSEMDIEYVESSGDISFIRPDQEIVPDSNLSEQNTSETTNETVIADTVSELKNDTTIIKEDTRAFDKKYVSGDIPVIDKEKKQIHPEKRGVHSYVEMEGKNASLHIPLSETLKFWLVGAVVLLMIVGALVLVMAYLITRFTD